MYCFLLSLRRRSLSKIIFRVFFFFLSCNLISVLHFHHESRGNKGWFQVPDGYHKHRSDSAQAPVRTAKLWTALGWLQWSEISFLRQAFCLHSEPFQSSEKLSGHLVLAVASEEWVLQLTSCWKKEQGSFWGHSTRLKKEESERKLFLTFRCKVHLTSLEAVQKAQAWTQKLKIKRTLLWKRLSIWGSQGWDGKGWREQARERGKWCNSVLLQNVFFF